MSVFEELFESTVLEVVVPDTSVDFPTQNEADEWLRRVQSEAVERKQAFFGKFRTNCLRPQGLHCVEWLFQY